MANEIGDAGSCSAQLPGYTLVSRRAATIGGTITAFRLQCQADSEVTVKVVLMTASGNNLTAVAGSIRSVTLPAQGYGSKEWTAPGDFAAITVSAGQYLAAFCPTSSKLYYEGNAGSGIWYQSGDQTAASNTGFDTDDNDRGGIAGDITAAGGATVVPPLRRSILMAGIPFAAGVERGRW